MTRPVHLPGWGVGTITESPLLAARATPLERWDAGSGRNVPPRPGPALTLEVRR